MRKLALTLLGVSVLLNFALAALFIAGSNSAPVRVTGIATVPVAKKPLLPAIDARIWSSLESPGLSDLVRNMRAAGFPPEIVRAIAVARLDEASAGRLRALFPRSENLPYWKTQASDPNQMAMAMKLHRERQQALREVLGPDNDPDDPFRQVTQGRRVDGLPPDKAEAIRRIFQEFDDKRTEAYSSGLYNIERDKIAALEKAQHDAIARVLTPGELEEFDLRNSNTSRMMRYELSAFNPIEAEFRALFRLRQPFDEQYNNFYTYTGLPPPDQQRQRADAQRLLNEQIKSALGPERGADYERATDSNYRQTSQLVARLELPPDTTNQIWAVQKDLQQRAMDLMRNGELAPTVRMQQLAGLQQEAVGKLTPLLGGARGLEAYKQYGGSWMQMLQPRTGPPRRP